MMQAEPGSGTGVQNGAGPGTGGGDPSTDEYAEPAALYTVNALYIPNVTGLPPVTATPGTTVYFEVRASGPGADFTQSPVAPEEADLVAIQISGKTNAGAPFQMAADRATIMAEDNCGFAEAYSDPRQSQMPFFGFYAQAYRYVAWKVPPFMPEGTYQVRMFAYQDNGSTPRYFTASKRIVALGTIIVTAGRGVAAGTSLRFGSGTPPSASNPVFGLTWTATDFDNTPATLRTTIQNVATGRYYCISPGSSILTLHPTTCAGLRTDWDANMPVSNSGAASVRYNTTALFGGQQAAVIPAGNYNVFLDVVDDFATSAANEQYLSSVASTLPPITLP